MRNAARTSMLEAALDPEQRARWEALNSPARIQAWLDRVPYIAEERNRSPLAVLQDGQCHCLDGGLLAAAALRRLGYAPLLVELWPGEIPDDDHVLAVYRLQGRWGALAKSNFTGLRFREPVYQTLRELVMSYFEFYTSLEGHKTLRSYTRPLDLRRYDRLGWETNEAVVRVIEQRLHELPRRALIPPAMAANLSPADERLMQANLLGTDLDEAFGQREGTQSVGPINA